MGPIGPYRPCFWQSFGSQCHSRFLSSSSDLVKPNISWHSKSWKCQIKQNDQDVDQHVCRQSGNNMRKQIETGQHHFVFCLLFVQTFLWKYVWIIGLKAPEIILINFGLISSWFYYVKDHNLSFPWFLDFWPSVDPYLLT